MSAAVAVLVFPGTNSEHETLRALHAVGLAAELVHWSRPEALGRFDAFVLPGGFAYEDRIRAGAVSAHDELMDPVIEAARAGKFVLGICNGAQILAEAALVPGTGPLRRPTAAFAPNENGRFESVHVHVKLNVAPARVPILAGIEVFPFEAPADVRYGALRAELERTGGPIGANDMLIAAQALSLGLTLVTANEREFARVSGLNIENWLR